MARKNVDAIQSASGQIAGLISDMLRIRDKLGVTPDEFHVLFTPEGEEHFEKMIGGLKKKPIVEAVKKAVAILVFVTTAVVPAIATPMDPNEAFQSHQGFYVCGDFRSYVLPALKSISSAPEASFIVSRIALSASDSTIHKEIPENHLAEWYHILSFIGKQPNGENGVLLTNGYANIFYMRGVGGQVFVVSVRRGLVSCRWSVDAWRLGDGGDGGWPADDLVFSCNSQAT